MILSVQKLNQDAILPAYAHDTDAGMDLFCFNENAGDVVLEPGARGLFGTQIAVAIPMGMVGLIWDKSGLAVNSGLKVLGGVVDAGYRGEVKVGLLNVGTEPVVIQHGQKVAQMLVQTVSHPTIEEVSELPAAGDTRGNKGFGSTGLRKK